MMKPLEHLCDFFSRLPMTLVSGVFLVWSLAFMLTDLVFPIDPAWATIIISGLPLFYLALTRLLFQRWISSALLISIAMAAAIGIGEFFAAGEVAFIMALGAILEEKTVSKAKKGLRALINLSPTTGRLLKGTSSGFEEEMVPAELIQRGDLLRVLPGEIIPADGLIDSGVTSINQSIMTGESLPVDKVPGDPVFCGTMNCHGSVDIRATRTGSDTSLQRMIDLVREAETKKAPTQRIVDRWATWLVPVALVIAVATYFATGDLTRAVTVLVVFCPCALVLATPTSIMAAIGQATKRGVLIKSGEALEKMGIADCIAFDKTGTLTKGELEVSDVMVMNDGITEDDLLFWSASIEKRSEHPVGKAIVRYANALGISLREVSDFRMLPGKGVTGMVDGESVSCGNVLFLKEQGMLLSEGVLSALERLYMQGKAVIPVFRQKECVGIIALADSVRPEAESVIVRLKELGVHLTLLSGDHLRTAQFLGSRLGIDDVHAPLLPEGKVACIQQLQAAGRQVCMIGDGVNDAPALKSAAIGVAMGSMGSDIAIESADIALMSDDLSQIPYLKRLANAAIRTIKVNIAASMLINLVAITLSVMGVLTPVTGALVHNVGSVLVVLNAALLYDRKFA